MLMMILKFETLSSLACERRTSPNEVRYTCPRIHQFVGLDMLSHLYHHHSVDMLTTNAGVTCVSLRCNMYCLHFHSYMSVHREHTLLGAAKH